MSQHGANLQTYNQELVKCLEDLKSKRSEILGIIQRQELDRDTLAKNIKSLEDKLAQIDEDLQKNRALYDSYDKTITDTESGFQKILESSQTLLSLVQQEATKLKSHEKPMSTHRSKN